MIHKIHKNNFTGKSLSRIVLKCHSVVFVFLFTEEEVEEVFAEDYDSDDEVVSEPKHEHQPAEPMHQNVSSNIYELRVTFPFLTFLINYNTIRSSVVAERNIRSN